MRVYQIYWIIFFNFYWYFNFEIILCTAVKKSSYSRTLSSLFLNLSLNDFFSRSLREPDISFHSLATILERHFFFFFLHFKFWGFYVNLIGSRRVFVVRIGLFCKKFRHWLDLGERIRNVIFHHF